MVYVKYHQNDHGVVDYWKVENSWGNCGEYGGHLGASGKWFRDFTYNFVVKKKYLSEEERSVWTSNEFNKTFPLWDPMGTLAI